MILLGSALFIGALMPSWRGVAFGSILGLIVAALFYFNGPTFASSAGMVVGAYLMWWGVAALAQVVRRRFVKGGGQAQR